MFANAESMLLAFKKRGNQNLVQKNKEVYYNLLKVSTLLELKYPEPGSNRHGLPHWCLRPARLPIPPSGLQAYLFDERRCKGTHIF